MLYLGKSVSLSNWLIIVFRAFSSLHF